MVRVNTLNIFSNRTINGRRSDTALWDVPKKSCLMLKGIYRADGPSVTCTRRKVVLQVLGHF